MEVDDSGDPDGDFASGAEGREQELVISERLDGTQSEELDDYSNLLRSEPGRKSLVEHVQH